MSERRITVEEVKAAYAKTGLRPRRNMFLFKRCACGLGAMCAAAECAWLEDDKNGGMSDDDVQAALGLDSQYVFGFVRGFDGDAECLSGRQRDGYTDGRAAAGAIFGGQA